MEYSTSTLDLPNGPGSCITRPISLGAPTDTVVVELYGTGLRHLSSLSALSVQIDNQTVPVQYAGKQSTDLGLDQNQHPVPQLGRPRRGDGSGDAAGHGG